MRLHVHSYGDPASPPVMCVHGVTGHGERFRKLAEETLSDRHVVAVDLRGHGRSGYDPPWNLETQVNDLVETADSLGIALAPWLGFSLGGRLVAEVAARAPERIERLGLLDPALELAPGFAREAAEGECEEETFASAGEAIEARLAAGTLIATPRELLEEEMAQALEDAGGGRLRYRYSRVAAIAAWGEMARPAPPPAPRPTLFVVGDESYVPNEDQVRRYATALGDLLTVVRVHSGHSVLWDAFADTAAAVAAFVA